MQKYTKHNQVVQPIDVTR